MRAIVDTTYRGYRQGISATSSAETNTKRSSQSPALHQKVHVCLSDGVKPLADPETYFMSVHTCVRTLPQYLSHSYDVADIQSQRFGRDDWKVDLLFIVPASAKTVRNSP